MIKKFLLTVFLVVNLLLSSSVFGQSLGDYRSVATGNWTALSSWQYYNGSAWVTPTGTSPQGYPGQFTGTGAVFIQAGNKITIASAITTFSFGTLTITGTLTLTGDNSSLGMDFYLTTQSIIVTPSAGFIEFNNKINLRLPTDASIQVTAGGLDVASGCSANQLIYIGNIVYSKCNGGGSLPDFGNLMTSGGTLNPIATSNSPICQNDTVNLFGSKSGASGTTTSGGATSGVNYSWSIQAPNASTQISSLQNYSFTGSQTGNYSVTLTCTTYFGTTLYTNSKTITVVVNAKPATPAASATSQPTCAIPTGTITVTAPANGTGISYTVTGTNPVVAAVTNTTGLFSGLAAGTYNVTTTNATGCISLPISVTINPLVTNTWTASGWSNNTPTGEQNIIFNANYAVNADVVACSCQVNPNNNVTILSGKTLTLTNELTVKLTGVLTFEDKASLVQINNASINSGDIISKRKTTSVLSSDFTYWSSPVFNQLLTNVSPSYASGMFYSYDDFASPENWKQEIATAAMVTGKGYIIRGPQITSPPAFYDATFTGVPNNGTKTIAIGATGTSNLLGNPYPSAINADLFLATNSSLVEGTIYLWTHKTAIQSAGNITNGTAGSGAYAYTSDDYASYNFTGGVGTGIGNFVNGVQQIVNKPTGKIAAGQAFFTTSIGNGKSVTFNNAMRLSSTGAILDNSQFFKSRNPKTITKNVIEKNRIWLNLTNTQGAFKQALIGYVTDATNDYDSRFDGESLDGNEFVDFYSVNQDKNLTIQGRALPFNDTDEVPLGFSSTIDGDFTINIDQVDGSLTNQAVFIEDKLTNTVIDLKSGNYTFNTVAGTFNDRFVLKYKDTNKTLNVNETDKEDGILVLYSNNYKTLVIHNNVMDSTVNTVTLYNITGQKISNWDVKDSEQTNIQIPIKNISSGIYIVKVDTTKGESSKKIVVN